MANMKMVNGVVMPCTAQDEAEIVAKEALAADKKKTEYLNQRKDSYPTLIELIDYLYDSMQANEIPACKALIADIDAIKAKYPAPV